MTTATTLPDSASSGRHRSPALPGGEPRADLAGALRSEWTKIRSVRSTFWTLLATIAVTVGLSALFAWGNATHATAAELAQDDLTSNTLSGLFLGQLVVVVFGAMAVTAEYSTGMIRTSFTSQPRRGVLMAAKIAVAGAAALVVGLVSSFASFLVGARFYTSHGVHLGLGDPHVLRAVIGGGLYLAVSALIAFGLGAILRHTGAAISAAVGLLFVLWIMTSFLPGSWRDSVGKWIPFNAGGQIIATRPAEHMLAPWTGFAVFAGYAAIALVAGVFLTRRRDA